jgi:AcrR family transcriptional regulator
MGFGGTRLEDIAAEAGLSRTTIYHHFDSKRTVLVDLGRTAVLGYRAVIEVARSTPTDWRPGDLEELVGAQLAFLDEHGAVIPVWTEATWNDPELRDLGLAAHLRELTALGAELVRLRGRSDVDPVHQGIVFMGMIERMWFFARSGAAGALSEDSVRHTLLVELASLLTPADRRR